MPTEEFRRQQRERMKMRAEYMAIVVANWTKDESMYYFELCFHAWGPHDPAYIRSITW